MLESRHWSGTKTVTKRDAVLCSNHRVRANTSSLYHYYCLSLTYWLREGLHWFRECSRYIET